MIRNIMTPSCVARNDPLTQTDALLSSISSISEAARSDIAIFGDHVYQACLDYNNFETYHNQAPLFRGDTVGYLSTWRKMRSNIVKDSRKIKAQGEALYNKWGLEGTSRLWDTLEELCKWWDAVCIRADSWISEMGSLEEPKLEDWQEVKQQAKLPRPQIVQWLQDTLAIDKANAKAPGQSQLATAASQSTRDFNSRETATPPRPIQRSGLAGTRAQIQSHAIPSTPRAELRKPATGSILSDRPSNRGTSRKPKYADDPESQDVIPSQSHQGHGAPTSATSEPTRDMDTMRISQQRDGRAPAAGSVVQPSADTMSSYRSEPSTTTAPSSGWDSTRTNDEPETW